MRSHVMESVAATSRQASRRFKKRFLFALILLVAILACAYAGFAGSRMKITELPLKIDGQEFDYTNVKWISGTKFVYSDAYTVVEYDLETKKHKALPIEGRQADPHLKSSLSTFSASIGSGRTRFVVLPQSLPGAQFSPSGKHLVDSTWSRVALSMSFHPTGAEMDIFERTDSGYRKVAKVDPVYSFLAWKSDDTMLLMKRPMPDPKNPRSYRSMGLYEWDWRSGEEPEKIADTESWLTPRYTTKGTLLFESGAVLTEYSLDPYKQIRKVKLPMPKNPTLRTGGISSSAWIMGVHTSPPSSSIRVTPGSPTTVVRYFGNGSVVSASPDGRYACHVDVENRPSILRKVMSKITSATYAEELYVLRITDLETGKSRELMTFPKASPASPIGSAHILVTGGSTFVKWADTGDIHLSLDQKSYLIDMP